MGATSVTGTGPGDSAKRVAYLSSDLPSLQVTETTTGNKQDLITTTGGGSGCGCDFNTQWEIAYSRAITDGSSDSDVPTGIAHDPAYEWAFGIYAQSSFIPAMSSVSLAPITNEALNNVMILHGGGADFSSAFTSQLEWSPDGLTYYVFKNETFSALHFGAKMPDATSTNPYLTMLLYNLSSIKYDGAGTYGPAGNFTTSGIANIEGTQYDVYFVICRRPLVN